MKKLHKKTTEQLPVLQIFENEEFGSVRTIIIDNKPWFVGKDICQIFGDTHHTRSLGRIDDEDKKSTQIIDSLGRNQNVIVVNESGLYSLLFSMQPQKSKKKDGVPDEDLIKKRLKKLHNFKRWVTSEVLPQIRKTGGYIPVREKDTDLEIMAKAHQIMERTIEEKNKKIEEQQILLEEKDAKIEEQQERIEDLEETEKDWKTLMDTTGTFSINQLSQFINIGEYHLFEYLRKLKVLWKNENNDNVPYRQHLSSGKFAVVPAVAPNGVVHSQTRVYPEGIPYITKLLRKNGYLA